MRRSAIRASQTLRFLDLLFQRLARLGTPVNVVMISEGLFLGRIKFSGRNSALYFYVG